MPLCDVLLCDVLLRYDLGMVSVVTLGVGRNCDLKPTYPKSHQNHIKTVSKSYQNHIKTVSKSYQNHIKIISKPQKPSKKSAPGLFPFPFLEANSLEPYQNRIKAVSKSHQSRIKITSKTIQDLIKPFQNDIKTTKSIQKSIL